LDLQFYLDLGTYDIAQLILLVRSFIPILQAKGYSYEYIEYHEGHSWGNWRAHIDNALEMFFPNNALNVKEAASSCPTEFRLLQNYPNPFNERTTIEYQLSEEGDIEIGLFNLHGQLVCTLVDGPQKAGHHFLYWKGTDAEGSAQPSGIYFLRAKANGENREVRRILLLR